MQKIGILEQKLFLLLRSDFGAGALFAILFTILLNGKRLENNFWIVFFGCLLGFAGIGIFTGLENIFFFLAFCVPICAYALVTREKAPERYDFHDMGGKYHRGAKLVDGGSSNTAFTQLSKEDGKPGINLFPNKPFAISAPIIHTGVPPRLSTSEK